MKTYLIFLIALLQAILVFGQTEGVVVYEETMKIDVNRIPAEWRSMVPPERRKKTKLVFTETESLYKNMPLDNNVANQIESGQGGGGGMMNRWMQAEADNQTYKDLDKNYMVEKQNFMGREFLIADTQEEVKWKVTSEQKTIKGYMCMKATTMRDTIPVTAWFTPMIPVSTGPATSGQLPGLILEVDVNNGFYLIQAISVEVRALNADEKIVVPDQGKKVSREEFNKIRDEKIKEMREMGGGRMMFTR
jgi:GLPGLI family protein